MTPIAFVLNGGPVRVDAAPPGTTLLDVLRDRGLTGAKEGCAEGECGACTVALVVDAGGRTEFRAVNSCLMLLPMAAGHDITTIEALAHNGELADAQRAMAAAGGSQCGYCTPGFVMSLFVEQYRPGRQGACDVEALAGNLCRCTGYRPIRDAALSLGSPSDERFLQRLAEPAPLLDSFTSNGFSRPRTIAECVALLDRHPDATLIAGGTDLVVESNLRARRWPHLVSLEAVDELRAFDDSPSHVRLGAAMPLTDIGRRWTTAPPVVGEWLTRFASPLIRNRATLGGNLATASPIGDSAPLLLALNARVEIAGPVERRTVPLAAFFLDYRRTVLRRGEMLAAVEIPKPLPAFVRFYKVAKRRADDISTVAAAMSIDRDNSGRIIRARLAFGGVAATPLGLTEQDLGLEGSLWDDRAVERIQSVIRATLHPLTDHRGSAEYRLQVAQRLVEKFAWESQA